MTPIPEILSEIFDALREKNWGQLELKAHELEEWAAQAARAATDPGNNEHPDGGKQCKDG